MSNLEQARKQNAITRRREEKMGFHGMRAFEIAMNLAGHGRNLDPELAAAAIEYDVNKESQKEAQKEARLEAQKEAIRECCPLNLSQTQSPAPLRILTGYSILRTPCPPLNLSQTPQPPAPLSTLPGYNTLHTPCPPLNLSTPSLCPQTPTLLSSLEGGDPHSATPILSPVPKGVVIEYEELD